jgi:two-component system cell cycle response regulator CpdR
LQPLSILYVEDNDHLREAIGMLMEADGREVVVCASGEEAVVLDAQTRFDVVITDVSLPGMSGTDLARKILHDNASRWVVLCSGYDFSQSTERLGAKVRSLRKPFEIEELDALLAEIAADVARASEAPKT